MLATLMLSVGTLSKGCRGLGLGGPARPYAHRVRQDEARLLAGPRWQDHNRLICTRWGKPFAGPNDTRYYQHVLERASLQI